VPEVACKARFFEPPLTVEVVQPGRNLDVSGSCRLEAIPDLIVEQRLLSSVSVGGVELVTWATTETVTSKLGSKLAVVATMVGTKPNKPLLFNCDAT